MRCSLNFSNFLSHNNGVALADLLGAHGLVVEAAVVLVAVSMYGAEETAAPAGEPGQPHLLLARLTPVLLLLPLLVPAVPGVARGGRGGSGPEDGVG